MKKISYQALLAKQAKDRQIFVFKAKPKDILSFSEIDRIGRNEDGSLKGFQRHQVAPHIKEIASYLETEEAILPNAIILAFIDGLEIESSDNDSARVTISYDKNKNFKNYANPASIVWQSVETKYWKDYLRNRIEEFTNETGSLIGAKILKNFSEELNNFVQVCPFEMLDKLHLDHYRV